MKTNSNRQTGLMQVKQLKHKTQNNDGFNSVTMGTTPKAAYNSNGL